VLSFEDQVATLVNSYRAKNGLAPLTLNWQLSRMAASSLRICAICVLLPHESDVRLSV
jgi:uncharacterized protein YkwD